MDIHCKKKLRKLYKSKIDTLKHLCQVYGKKHTMTKEMQASKDEVEKLLNAEGE